MKNHKRKFFFISSIVFGFVLCVILVVFADNISVALMKKRIRDVDMTDIKTGELLVNLDRTSILSDDCDPITNIIVVTPSNIAHPAYSYLLEDDSYIVITLDNKNRVHTAFYFDDERNLQRQNGNLQLIDDILSMEKENREEYICSIKEKQILMEMEGMGNNSDENQIICLSDKACLYQIIFKDGEFKYLVMSDMFKYTALNHQTTWHALS